MTTLNHCLLYLFTISICGWNDSLSFPDGDPLDYLTNIYNRTFSAGVTEGHVLASVSFQLSKSRNPGRILLTDMVSLSAPGSERVAWISKTCYLFNRNEHRSLLLAGWELRGCQSCSWTYRRERKNKDTQLRVAAVQEPQNLFAAEMGELNMFPLNLNIGLGFLECFSPPLSIIYWKEGSRDVGADLSKQHQRNPTRYLSSPLVRPE